VCLLVLKGRIGYIYIYIYGQLRQLLFIIYSVWKVGIGVRKDNI